jgi:Zn ribbon nucleic-acid-binding protein
MGSQFSDRIHLNRGRDRGRHIEMPKVIAKAVCPTCNDYIPKRVTYLYEESLNSWLCKSCWHNKYDAKTNILEVANG